MTVQMIESELQRAQEMHQFVVDQLAAKYEPDEKQELLARFLSIVKSHHEAILVLTHHQRLYGSAFALLRPLIETACRGLYVAFEAGDARVQKLKEGKDIYPVFNCMVDLLDDLFDANGLFGRFGGRVWKTLCGYTHGGLEQLTRQIGIDGAVQPTYDPAAVQELINGATAGLVLIAIPFLNANGREEAAIAISDRYIALYPLPHNVQTVSREARGEMDNSEDRKELLAYYEKLASYKLSKPQAEELFTWEKENLDGSTVATSDWPGWESLIGKKL